MERYVLNESLLTGVKMIDVHHRELVEAINDLADAIETGKGNSAVKKILTFLKFYAEWHFDHEEKCAHKNQCPLAATNKEAHTKFLATVNSFSDEYREHSESEQGETIARKIHQALGDWLITHIKGIDVKLGEQILAAEASS